MCEPYVCVCVPHMCLPRADVHVIQGNTNQASTMANAQQTAAVDTNWVSTKQVCRV